jgi:hypothetical protein
MKAFPQQISRCRLIFRSLSLLTCQADLFGVIKFNDLYKREQGNPYFFQPAHSEFNFGPCLLYQKEQKTRYESGFCFIGKPLRLRL